MSAKINIFLVILAANFPSVATAQNPRTPPPEVTSEAAGACVGLLSRTTIDERQSLLATYSYQELTSEKQNVDEGSNGTYLYGISGGQTYKTAHDRASQIGLGWKVDESSSYIASFLPANQSSDYLNCVTSVESASDGAVGIALDDNASGTPHFTLFIRGSSTSGARHLVIWTNGIPVGTWQKRFTGEPQTIPLAIDWPDSNRPLVIRAQMVQNSSSNFIGRAAKYILNPTISERRELHISDTQSVRHPNQAPYCDCKSAAIIVRAAEDEVLLLNSIKTPTGTVLHKTWGQKDIPCSENKIVFDKGSDSAEISAYVQCTLGLADENPGYEAHFEVTGVHIILPVPDPNIKMKEKMY